MPVRFRTPARSTAALVLLFALSLPAVTTRFYASDEIQFFAWLRSVVFDRDADFDNEYRYFYDTGRIRDEGFRITFLEEINEAGRRRNFTPIGTALLWAPFFAIGHVAALATGVPADGFSQPYISAVTYGSATYGFLALILTHAIVRRVVGGAAWIPTVVVWIGTPLVFYMYVAPGFSHACSAFAVSLFLWIWLKTRTSWTPAGVACLGASAALMAMVREQDVFFAAGPAIDALRWSVSGAASVQATVRSIATGVTAAALSYLPQLAAYQALNGHPGPGREVARKMTWSSPHALEVLWSPAHGLFFWTPLALIAIVGLVWLAAKRPRDAAPDASWIALVAILMVALQTYVSGSVESWTVAGSFGQRRFVALTPILALGLAVWSEKARAAARVTPRVLVTGLMALLVWWNIGLMAQFGLHLMDRQRLSLGRNARTTFIDLPLAMPSLVVRYFTDRASFYRQPRQDRE
jgi:hypothetical protein